jgi:hypothetical protein
VKRALAVAAFACAVLTPSVSVASSRYPGFHTPGRSLYCRYSQARPLALTCWRPKDGYTMGMHIYGKPYETYDPTLRNAYEDASPVLGYGKTWGSFKVIGCRNTRANLLCKNRRGHGWTFSKKGHRVF